MKYNILGLVYNNIDLFIVPIFNIIHTQYLFILKLNPEYF